MRHQPERPVSERATTLIEEVVRDLRAIDNDDRLPQHLKEYERACAVTLARAVKLRPAVM